MSRKKGDVPEGWEALKLRDVISSMDSGVSVNGDDTPAKKGEKGVLKVSAVSYGIFDAEANKRIIEADLDRAKLNPKSGAIVVSRANTADLVGASAYIDQDYPDVFLPDKLWQISPDQVNANTKWLSFFLSAKQTRVLISGRATGTSSGMKNISQDAFLNLPILLPPLLEQRKIATILSQWDESLATLSKLLEAKRQQKRGLAEQLLKGKRRLPGFEEEWEEKALGEVFQLLIGGTPSRNTPEFWDPDKVTDNVWLAISDLKGKYVASSKERISDLGIQCSNVKRVPENTVLMSFKLTLGRAAITTRSLYTNEAICAFIPKDNSVIDVEYFYQSIAVMDFSDGVDIAVKGMTMNKEKLTKFSFLLPQLLEQQGIASILSTLDAEIASLEALKAKVQEQKRGLMDVLLTGQVRVKVTEG